MRPLHASALALLLTVACLLPAAAAGASDRTAIRPAWRYNVRMWTTLDGLPHNKVHGIAQDSEGFIWVATWNGLARFDGHRFTLYDTRNTPGLRTRGFKAVASNELGDLVAGSTRQGLWRFQDGLWVPIAPENLDNLWVTTVRSDGHGGWWVGTERGLVHVDRHGRRLDRWPEDAPVTRTWINSIAPDGEGGIMACTEDGLIVGISDSDPGQVLDENTGLPSSMVLSALRLHDGRLLVGTDNGVYVRGRNGGRFRPQPEISALRVDGLLQDAYGTIWANTNDNGLILWDGGREFSQVSHAMGMRGRATFALVQDREGLVWAGTSDGLARIADGVARTLHTDLGLVDNYVRSVLATRDGSIWIGSSRGVNRWHDERVETIAVPWLDHREGSVMALAEDDAGIWLGTDNQGLIRIPHVPTQPALRVSRNDGLPATQVRALLTSRDGSLWIGTIAGLARRHPDGRLEHIRDEALPRNGVVRSLHEDARGGLWIGTANGAAYRAPDGRIIHYDRHSTPPLPVESAFDFLADPDGTVWIGSDGGLIRFRDGRFTIYGHDSGMPNESLFRVLPADEDALWLASDQGVFRISRAQFNELDSGQRSRLAPEIVDRADGMRSNQANGNTFPAGAIDRQGRLWVPTPEGVVTIDPRAMAARQATAPRTVIESVNINGVPHPTNRPIRVRSGDVNRVVFQFAGLNFRNLGNLVYRYRLQGVDPAWIDAGTSTEAVYTNLPAGQLEFHVEAIVRPDDWGMRHRVGTTSVALHIMPPFWETSPFRLSMLALLIVAFVLVQRAMQMVLIRRQRVLARLVEERTAELQEKNQALEVASRERQQLLEKLELQATHDDLTSLPNRRAARRELERLVDQRRVLQVALVDADHFKRINDTWGHDAGDRVLIALADHLRDTVAGRGSCARLGGEEFLMVLPDISQDDALECCEMLRRAVESTPVPLPDGRSISFTVSIGLSSRARDTDAQVLLNQADLQTYRAKAAGRNRVCADIAVAQLLG